MKNKEKTQANVDTTKRGFVAGLMVLGAGLFTRAASQVATFAFDGGLAPLLPRRSPNRKQPIIPPGAQNIRNFRRRCTACQQCVVVCENNVLRPSESAANFMQPHLSFERGWCRTECTKCSQTCPTGAIMPITVAEKSSTQIGIATWKEEICVVNTDNIQCDLCAHRCPTGAIRMVPKMGGTLLTPMVDTARCNGCGSCEYACPARPYSAIYVEGVDTHRII